MQSLGDDLVSIKVADVSAAQGLAHSLRQQGGWIDVVAGIDSVVVRYDNAILNRDEVEQRISDCKPAPPNATSTLKKRIEIPVVYGGDHGPDLLSICTKLQLSPEEFIDLHCGEYTVDMLGFIPGFAYIGGLDARLAVDRLTEPRQFVAAGSVGIAGRLTGLYSLAGPGGWPLIGRTSRVLFDVSADDPFLLEPGVTIIFTAVDEL